ncbi:hypothetical protein JNO42_12510 [Pseudomonas putida]|uniref:hypothetical protein n=1 Tax=Pseudomonas TaxID=286 RepID=UPI0006D43580|nr:MULTISPECIES: hypothetical protein [Pseudomonas]ULL07795.1 hypothetical protein JNO42_12510 [Pseudomonas putida]
MKISSQAELVSRDLSGFVINQLNLRKGDWPEISRASEVPYFTITKMAAGTTRNPRVNTVQRLANYFLDNPLAA